MVFHTTKHGLSRSETLPLANSDFVNRPFTDKYPRNHLSVNALQKTSKIGVFSTKNIFVQKEALNLGSKIEFSFTKSRYSFCQISESDSSEQGIFNAQQQRAFFR